MVKPGPKPRPVLGLPQRARSFRGPYPRGLRHPEARYTYKDYHERVILCQVEEELLVALCRQVQLAEEAAAALAEQELVLCDRRGRHYTNPLVRMVTQAHQTCTRLAGDLERMVGRRLASEHRQRQVPYRVG